MNRLSLFLIGSLWFVIFFCTATSQCTEQKPDVQQENITTNSSDITENKNSFSKENTIIAALSISLFACVTYIYYRHIQNYNKIIPHPSSSQDNSGTLSSTAPSITEQPRLRAEFSLSQFTNHPDTAQQLTASLSDQLPAPLHISTSENKLQTVLSQPSLGSTQTPIGDLVRARKLSATPPTYAQPLAVHLPELGSPSTSTNNLPTNPALSSPGSCLFSPTTSMMFSQTYRKLLQKLETEAQGAQQPFDPAI